MTKHICLACLMSLTAAFCHADGENDESGKAYRIRLCDSLAYDGQGTPIHASKSNIQIANPKYATSIAGETVVKTGVVVSAVNTKRKRGVSGIIACGDQFLNLHLLIRDKALLPLGDIVCVRGNQLQHYDFFSEAQLTEIARIGRTNEISARVIDGVDISCGYAYGQSVAATGIVSSATSDSTSSVWTWITIWTGMGPFHAVCANADYPMDRLNQLRGAKVIVCGTASKIFSANSPMINFLQLFGTNGITVVESQPQDPFAVSRDALPHRQCTSGTVLAATVNTFIIKASNRSWLVSPLPDQPKPKPGQRATVVGYRHPSSRNATLCDAFVRIDSQETPLAFPPAPKADPTMLSPGCIRETPVRIVGIMSDPPAQNGANTTLRINCEGHDVYVDITAWNDTLGMTLEPGSLLEISGYIIPMFGDGIIRPVARIERLMMMPRCEADISVVTRPPWWTSTRLFIALGVVFAALILLVFWNISLRALSEHRGRSLLRERLAYARAEAQIQERTHLAVEIHDTLSQSLTGVALKIEAAIKANDTHRENIGRQHLIAARQLLASCRHELCYCIWDLRNCVFSESDLTATIRKMLAPFGTDETISVRFNVPHRFVTDSVLHAVLRIVQELTANAFRHGKANRVRIAGELKDKHIRFSVTDDGTGFDTNARPGPEDGHFGLQGVTERLKTLQGRINLDSQLGKGTRVIVSIPLPKSAQQTTP